MTLGGPTMKILCTGDIHIGRRSSRVPRDLDQGQFSSSAAWDAIVEVALREQVDLLALSGDVVDRANRYFEAFGPLERGLRRLAEAGIDTVAVTGNHDFDVLPLLKRGAGGDRLHLLGLGGTWERWTVTEGGEPLLHVDGWSFPSEHVRTNPLDSYLPGADDGAAVLGLLHADLDQPGSPYAPVSFADLGRQRVTFWLLGHIHHPSVRETSGAPVMYPGSPQAMDPGEGGVHGPWLIDLRAGHPVGMRQILISRVRYEPLTIALDGIEAKDDLLDAVTDGMQRRLSEIAGDAGDLECVGFRVTVSGRTGLHRELAGHLSEMTGDFRLHSGRTQSFVERLVFDTRPTLSLDDLAKRNDPPGALARTVLALEADPYPAAYRRLIDDTHARMTAIQRHNVYAGIADIVTLDRASVRAHLLSEGYRLLDTLVAQREGSTA
jgi:DNA repair protein SbcD/Mre11